MEQKKNTRKEIYDELVRCVKDPVYFIDNYAKIQHPVRGLVPFKTYPYQKDAIRGFIEHRFNIVLKGRQLGFTTIAAALAAWFVLFHKDKNVVVVATKGDVSKNMIRIIKNIIKYVPKYMMLAKDVVKNVKSIELTNGSRVTAYATAEDVGRSEAVSLLIMDEVAHIRNMDEIWTSIGPTVSAGGRVIMLSTPNGTDNWFAQEFQAAREGKSNFNCRFGTYVNPNDSNEVYDDRFPWWVHPEHDLEWFKNETRNTPPRTVAQEYLCFTGDTRIFTKRGLKKIEDVSVGDEVLTHKGRFKKVAFKNSRDSSDLYGVKTYSNRRETKVTSEHPVLHANLGWIPVSELKEKDNVCNYPKNIDVNREACTLDLLEIVKSDGFKILLSESDDKIFINDRRFKRKINRYVDVDWDLGYLIGLYLAEGHRKKNYFCFSFNREKELDTWVVRVCDILKEKFGFEDAKIYNSKTSKAATLQVCSQIISSFVALFYNGNSCYNKHLSSFAYDNGNVDFFEGIIDGLFEGAGCLGFEYDKAFSTASKELACDLQYLMTICGFSDFSVRSQNGKKEGEILGRKVVFSNSYEVKLLRTRMRRCQFLSDLKSPQGARISSYKNIFKENENFQITSILNKRKLEKPETVYNIEVEEDNSFVTEHFVVHNCVFNASGDTFLLGETIEALESRKLQPIERGHIDRCLWVWRVPEPGARYIISVDVARGDADPNRDFSAFHVIRIDGEKLEQCAEYKGKITPDFLGSLVVDVARRYNNAIVAPENNSGWSGQTIQRIQELGYRFLYYPPKNRSGLMMDQYTAEINRILPGYTVTTANRLPMLAKMEEYIRSESILLYSERLIMEFKTFIWNGGRPVAQRNRHDDLIMCLAGGIWVREESFMHFHRNAHMAAALIDGMTRSNKTTENFKDFNWKSNSIHDRARIAYHIESQNKIVMGNGDIVDLKWLYPQKKKKD